jgi:hypothetical protein
VAAGADREAPIHPSLIADAVRRLADGPFGFSRALAPEIRRELDHLPASYELPAVRGRTVVPAGYRRPVVVGHPNYLGQFESRIPEKSICLTGAWSALEPVPVRTATVAVTLNHPRHLAASALEHARRLAKRVRQIQGVHLAFKPRSPILVVLLPRPVDAEALPKTMDDLAGLYPELPGGLRIELTADVTTFDISRYAAILEQAMSREA